MSLAFNCTLYLGKRVWNGGKLGHLCSISGLGFFFLLLGLRSHLFALFFRRSAVWRGLANRLSRWLIYFLLDWFQIHWLSSLLLIWLSSLLLIWLSSLLLSLLRIDRLNL